MPKCRCLLAQVPELPPEDEEERHGVGVAAWQQQREKSRQISRFVSSAPAAQFLFEGEG